MKIEQGFDNRIKKFLKEQPNSTASSTIRQVETYSPKFKSYYNLFENFAFKLGIGMIVKEFADSKTDKTIGYIPALKYYPENTINEKPRTENLISESSPLSLYNCYDYLAKELLYRIMRIQNFEKRISDKE